MKKTRTRRQEKKTQKRKRPKAANERRRKTASLQFNIPHNQDCNFKHINRGTEIKVPFKPLN